jgi:hypothetical protein
MHKHFSRFEKSFFIAGHPIADLEINIEIRDKMMMMMMFIQKKITYLQLGGNYELKVARYYSLLLNSTLCPIDFTLLRNTGKILYKEFKSQKPL